MNEGEMSTVAKLSLMSWTTFCLSGKTEFEAMQSKRLPDFKKKKRRKQNFRALQNLLHIKVLISLGTIESQKHDK